MRTFRKTLLALFLSAALAFLGPRQSFSALERFCSSCITAPQEAMPYVPDRTGMSRHDGSASEVIPISAKEHLQESRHTNSSSGEYLFLPERISFPVPCRNTAVRNAFQETRSRLFLSCGVIRRKLIPRHSPFISF